VLNIHYVKRRQIKLYIKSKTQISNISQPLNKTDTLLKMS